MDDEFDPIPTGVVIPIRRKKEDEPPPFVLPRDGRPRIRLGDGLEVLMQQTIEALVQLRPPLYRRGDALIEVAGEGEGAHLREANDAVVTLRLAELIQWTRVAKNNSERAAFPTPEVVRALSGAPPGELQPLDEVATAPVMIADGSVVVRAGYCERAALWMAPAFEPLPVPEVPTDSDVAGAVAALLDLMADFPFDAESDKTQALGAMLLPFVRRLIDGPTPLHLFVAHTAGTGKTLLASAIAVMAIGRDVGTTGFAAREEEVAKQITSSLRAARQVIIIDNVGRKLESESLAQLATSVRWQARELGTSRDVDFPNLAAWFLTGNNITTSAEIARRCVRIRLNSPLERPHERPAESFRHPELLPWVRAERPRLVAAVLTLARNWVAKGRPRAPRVLGSFEAWSHVIGGILCAAGRSGWLGGQDALYEASDTESEETKEFIRAWAGKFSMRTVKAKELAGLAEDEELLEEVRGVWPVESASKRVGWFLRTLVDRRFDEWVVSKMTSRAGSKTYALRPFQNVDSEPGAEG